MFMIDGHIHIERGEYTLEWIKRFADKAIEMEIEEIWLLEHCYRFKQFVPMYDSVCRYSSYIDKWFHSKALALSMEPGKVSEQTDTPQTQLGDRNGHRPKKVKKLFPAERRLFYVIIVLPRLSLESLPRCQGKNPTLLWQRNYIAP